MKAQLSAGGVLSRECGFTLAAPSSLRSPPSSCRRLVVIEAEKCGGACVACGKLLQMVASCNKRRRRKRCG